MMNNMGGMMWGMGLVWLIIVVVLVLAAAALVKYLFLQRLKAGNIEYADVVQPGRRGATITARSTPPWATVFWV